MFQLNGKIAVITGSGSGIGKAAALLFAKQGAEIHSIDLNEKACQATVSEIQQVNGKAFMHACDVTNQQHIKELFNSYLFFLSLYLFKIK